MKLQQLHIQNFRKLNDVTISLSDASFLVGANNSGKSSTLDAIELLTSDKTKLEGECRSKYIDENGQEVYDESDIIIEGYFIDVPKDIIQQRGFNASRLKVINKGNELSYAFYYRVRFDNKDKSHREIKMHSLNLKEEYSNCHTFQDFINKGIDASYFEGKDLQKKLGKNLIPELENLCPEVFDIEENEEWFENPGGIPGNVLSQLPRFLKIKADVLSDEMAADKSGALHEILDILFSQVREASPNYRKAVDALSDLEKEMDTADPNTKFGELMSELNAVVDSVFHEASINVQTELTKPENLKAKFSASLISNVETPIERQGTGLIRATVFALLRYHKQREEQDANNNRRGLIIGFEEPELFLHPNAAEKMRDIIYELATNNHQIIATTHSPYMIDLSKDNRQVLNSFKMVNHDYACVTPFNLTDAFTELIDDDKTRVKLLQKIDSYVARIFFAQKTVIVEGDTEDIVFRQTINVMPIEIKKAIKDKYQIIKATGKATMISFIKYLRALNVDLFVVHDEDAGTPGAEKMNGPILEALGGDETNRLMMHNCIEDELDYRAPSSDKPYHAYLVVKNWNDWSCVPEKWKGKVRKVFSEFSGEL